MNEHPMRPTEEQLKMLTTAMHYNPSRYWGETPEMGFVLHEPGRGFPLRRHPIPVPDFLWGMVGRPYELLHVLREGQSMNVLRKMGPPAPRTVGMYAMTEAYITREEPDSERFRRALAGGSLPPLRDEPQAREARVISIVTVTADRYMSLLVREKEDQPHEHWSPAGEKDLRGDAFESCEAFLSSYLNRPLTGGGGSRSA